ncbi:unnamed protein product [Adineta steineri]|uniref:Uncharacterized protein n=1 Tax=Adineta steineri TaxID=433720 RepID=A0A814M5K2_9BILA|nr:unnamed protein product [Adineta steineri]CAF1322650.1 unnamed protein product [Adineta steineri]CAF1325091.1 unnamed protein product [Adineta steineri]
MYKFGFDNCDKIVQLSEEEIHRIPYLLTLISHKDDFLSIKNDKNEYILHHPICYNLLIPILNSINNENSFDVLQLFNYLCLNQSIYLNDQNRFFTYYREKNLCEVRNNAAQLVLSLTKNAYDLNDLQTIEYIFLVITIIFSRKSIFNLQFCYHTYKILEKCVFPLFFKKHPIYLLNDIKEDCRIDSNICFYNDNQGYYEVKMSDNQIKQRCILIVARGRGKSELLRELFGDPRKKYSTNTYNRSQNIKETELLSKESTSLTMNSNLYLNESQSARLGYYNTRPKQAQIDKFKHKYKTKVNKYR